MDFSLNKYNELLSALSGAGFTFQPFCDLIENPSEHSIVLRHDVDAKKFNSLRFARIQAEKEIRASYYFRIVPQSFDEMVIREIASLGHEIGYHYETMDSAGGDIDKAWDEFRRNLDTFRRIVPVKTICMHGSPLSKYDNRSLWEKYDYRSLGLIGEPYFDIDFHKVLYLNDTGRRWDGEKVSIRDKVRTEDRRPRNEERTTNNKIVSPSAAPSASLRRPKEDEGQNSKLKTQNSRHPAPGTWYPTFHTTNDIIQAANTGNLPDQLMLTFHPQRWTDKPVPWMRELVWQNMKNLVKRLIVK